MSTRTIKEYRYFLKDSIRKEINFHLTDQSKGKAPPEAQKPYDKNGTIIDLIKVDAFSSDFQMPLMEAIGSRVSVRRFSNNHLTLKELSFLLWATQGIKSLISGSTLRTVPSAGARHSFETYLYIGMVDGIEEGIYRYLPLSHQLVLEFKGENFAEEITGCCFGQKYTGYAAVTFIWAAIPYRMEWRYHLAAHKVIAIDAGHLCQNLYLACQAIDAGTCAIGAYDQEKFDELLELDNEEEFVVYLAPVGKKE